jgi:hypothetical protein
LARVVRRTAGAPFSCAAVSRRVWNDLGGLDAAAFPTQYNDADFWLRGLRRGLVCMALGHLQARHEPGGSEPRTVEETRARHALLCARHPDLAQFASLDPEEICAAAWPLLAEPLPAATAVGVQSYAAFRIGVANIKGVPADVAGPDL